MPHSPSAFFSLFGPLGRLPSAAVSKSAWYSIIKDNGWRNIANIPCVIASDQIGGRAKIEKDRAKKRKEILRRT
eukprot:scaffold269052_cov24-Attheya_sp.AAC.1